MKTIKLLSIGVLSIFLIVTSCSKDDLDNVLQTEDNYFSAKVDGVDFFTDFPLYLSSTEQIITVSGQNEQNTINIQISIFNYDGPRTYTIDNNTLNENGMIIVDDSGTWLTNKDNGSGSVTFVKEGRYLKGTFSFNAIHSQNGTTKNITEGKFNVQIIF